MKDIVILGAGGHAKVLFDACRSSGRTVRGFLDADPAGPGLFGVPVLGTDDMLSDDGFLDRVEVAVGLGLPHVHRRVTQRCIDAGAAFAQVTHASVTISDFVEIGAGSFVNAGAIINAATRVGRHCIVNTRVSIDHDCVLGDFVNIAPGAVLAGEVRCADGVFIGTGAAIGPGITIGQDAVIGAGAIILRDVDAGAKIVGTHR